MDRRTFVNSVVIALVAASLPAGAQQPRKLRKVAQLSADPFATPEFWAFFVSTMRDLGWTEGENIAYERRSANYQLDRLPELAAELIRLDVDVIFTMGAQAPLAASRATNTIPIVVWNAGDPVENRLAASLAHPGGNVTGVTPYLQLAGKRLQLIKEVVPVLSRVAVLWQVSDPNNVLLLNEAQQAAEASGIQIQSVEIRTMDDIDGALDAALRQRPGAMIVTESQLLFAQRTKIAAFTAANRLPTIYPVREFVDAGGLMAYGANLRELLRLVATYIDKILRGAKPADLPIQQPTKFELVINLKAAKALGLTIPQSLLVRADEVIQ